MRIFIGLTEVANCVRNYSAGLRELGFETLTVLTERAPAYRDSEYDLVLFERLGPVPTGSGVLARIRNLMWRLRFYGVALRSALSCDVFIFVFGSAFRTDGWDYRLLKLLRKRMVAVFLGDDTRYWYAFTREAQLLGFSQEIEPYLQDEMRDRPGDYFAVKLWTVKKAERYADLILALPDAAQLQSRPYMRVNIPIDLSRIGCDIPDRDIPLIVHAPSVRRIKGTPYVLAAVEQLRAEGLQFEFRLIERMPNDQLRELLRTSDIVIDQLYSETIATFALEGLASGNVVLTRYVPERALVGSDCPAVNVNMFTLADRLREVILNRGLRRELAERGRPYVERHHSHLKVAREIIEWLGLPEPIPHFVPTFLTNDFEMSPDVARREFAALEHEPVHLRLAARLGIGGTRAANDCHKASGSPDATESERLASGH